MNQSNQNDGGWTTVEKKNKKIKTCDYCGIRKKTKEFMRNTRDEVVCYDCWMDIQDDELDLTEDSNKK